DVKVPSSRIQFHDDLAPAVLAAYGWPATLTDAEILERLVALNAERAKEEASGLNPQPRTLNCVWVSMSPPPARATWPLSTSTKPEGTSSGSAPFSPAAPKTGTSSKPS